jgi:demethylmenaquinone methyltransferase/2-methoxy-6-polyprenyl-1,4-benzoquinol methylase
MNSLKLLGNDTSALARPSFKRAYLRTLFAVVAPRYFIATRVLSFFRDRSWKRFLIAKAGAAVPERVLDIATGSGDLAVLAAAKWPAALIVGADLSLAMLAAGRRRPETGALHLTCMDMSALGVRSHSIDLITGGYALRNAPDLTAALSEIVRVLKLGGTAAFLDFSRSPNRAVFFVQYWVLKVWGAFWGIMLHGNPAIYAYIAESLRLFPDREELRGKMIAAGFTRVLLYRRMFGLIDVIVGVGG